MINYDEHIIVVKNKSNSVLCVFSHVEEYTPYADVVEEVIDNIKYISLKIDTRSKKCDYLINENIIEYDGNEYLIVNRTLENDNKNKYYVVKGSEIRDR